VPSPSPLPSGFVTPETALRAFREGKVPRVLRVHGPLDLSVPVARRWPAAKQKLTAPAVLPPLPAVLTATELNLTGRADVAALPVGLTVKRLLVPGCTALTALPSGLRLYELQAANSGLEALPDDLEVAFRLDLTGCTALRRLPENLKTGSLVVRNCTWLEALPEGLEVNFLEISGCTRLRTWPERGSLRIGRLDASGCVNLRSLPAWLGTVSQLNITGCAQITSLPGGLRVISRLELADSGLTGLPESLRDAALFWKGVPVDARIAFHPETITAAEVLAERNAEKRRVLLERMGYLKFMSESAAEILDRDTDPGGERRLLRVPLEGEEPLVMLAVYCPSTGRQYVLRVPPDAGTCRKAAAWIAGYDNPDDYRPLQET